MFVVERELVTKARHWDNGGKCKLNPAPMQLMVPVILLKSLIMR